MTVENNEFDQQYASGPPCTPLVVVTGPTATGKTTTATAVASAMGLERHVASDRLVAVLQGRPKADRLRSWLTQATDAHRVLSTEADRATDLSLLAAIQHARRPVVVESVSLPLLLPPNNSALIVRLSASSTVRAARVQRMLPELSRQEAQLIVRRKDKATRTAMRAAWGVDPGSVSAGHWRADLVVQCPGHDQSSEEQACAATTAQLVSAAYAVYRLYLTDGPLSAGTTAAERLRELIEEHRDHIGRCSPTLTDGAGPFTISRWQRRLSIEHDRMRKALTP